MEVGLLGEMGLEDFIFGILLQISSAYNTLNLFTNLNMTDMETGYKLFKKNT